MLVDIEIKKENIQNEIEFCKSRINDDDVKDLKEFILNMIEELSKIESIDDIFDRIDIGIYEGYFDYYKIQEWTDLELEQFYSFNYFKNNKNSKPWTDTKNQYGNSDNVEQILEYYKDELNDKERKFILTYHKVYREKQSPNGGYRYHKNGGYIGVKTPISEYLYDDTHIEYVLQYHIYEILTNKATN